MQQSILLDDAPEAALYQRHAPTISAYLLRQTTSREDAEDLLLEVFLAALERANFPLMLEQEQAAWLWRVAHNKAADHFRRLTRHASVSLYDEALYADENLAPEQATIKQEERADLRATLHTLTQAQQEIVQLRFGHGLRCREIARVLGKNEAAVRMALSRTLRLLRSPYRQQEGGQP